MKGLLFLVFIILSTHSVTYFRLNTNENTQLSVGDILTSTLGLFRASLLQNRCMLSIQYFNTTYSKVGNYTSSNFTGNCNSLTIQDGRVVTDNNSTYMYVGSGYNLTTMLTIDDVGIIRLIGTYQLPDFKNQVSEEFNVTTFLKNQTYIFPVTNIAITFMTFFPALINARNWQFSASLGQLDISQFDNPGISISYSYANINVNNSMIADFNGNSFPNAIFPNISYNARCYEPRIYIDFKAPFVLVVDPNWPKITAYEQGRYKILEVSYSKVYQPYARQQSRRLFTRNEPSVCPPFTFEFNGNCTTTCPFPYYHELRGQHGYCVLTCEEFTQKNDATRICSCYLDLQAPAISSATIKACPSNALSYPYGCYCNSSNLFFDRLLTFSCVTSCPQTTFASNGLCMSCPQKCVSCQLDKYYRAYLECKKCSQGFALTGGQCYRQCSPGRGYSLVNGTCQACLDPNCLNCSTDVKVCTRCSALYSLSKGNCLQSCASDSKAAPYQKISSVCLPLDSTCSDVMSTYYKNKAMLKCNTCPANTVSYLNKCQANCPPNYIANANSFCRCSASGTLTVNEQCLVLPACPLLMGYDPFTSSCLSCDFGCATCFDLVCTSCSPGYFLFISPQTIRCRKSSPLFPCDQQYSWNNGVCLLIQYSNSLYSMTKCVAAVANCMVCPRNSATNCVLCKPGFLNYNNTCLRSCPVGTVSHRDQTCILAEIDNCSIPYFQVMYQSFVLNNDQISNSQAYKFYIYNGKEPSNDPVGYIPYYQTITTQQNDGMFRDSEFYYSSLTCLKCNDGLGLDSTFKSCQPCPNPCITCYMALNTSCLTVKAVDPTPPTPTPTPTPNTTCQYYIDFQSKQCIPNCSLSTVIPYIINKTLYCYPASSLPSQTLSIMDSSAFVTSNGSTHVFFVLDHSLDQNQLATLQIIPQSSTPKVSANSTPTPNIQQVKLKQSGYIYYIDNDPSHSVWIVNASGKLNYTASSSKLALSNPTYGVQSGQGYAAFRKTWLAYIGYIMGLVLICLHVVYIGNDLLYKVDNSLILAQLVYFFSFAQLLAGKLLSQFYYGWIFAHFGFFPSFFSATIPSSYIQLAAPNSFKLNAGDANIVRNAGWAFSLLIIFLCAYGLITFCCWIIANLFHKKDVWHPRIAINSLIGFCQFLSFTIFFWAVANVHYIGDSGLLSESFYDTSKTVSIFFIVLITLYTLLRWLFNPLGGLYMSKRILIATILACTYQDNRMLAPLVILEAVFTIFRFILQSPDRNLLVFVMLLESLLHIAAYLLLFLVLDAGINTIIISIIIFIMIVVLSYGLTNVYLQSQNQWQLQEKDDDSQPSIMKAQAERRVSKISMQ